MMNPPPRKHDEETQKAIDEYLKKGGKITYYAKGDRSEEIEFKGGFYTKRKKKKEEANKDD